MSLRLTRRGALALGALALVVPVAVVSTSAAILTDTDASLNANSIGTSACSTSTWDTLVSGLSNVTSYMPLGGAADTPSSSTPSSSQTGAWTPSSVTTGAAGALYCGTDTAVTFDADGDKIAAPNTVTFSDWRLTSGSDTMALWFKGTSAVAGGLATVSKTGAGGWTDRGLWIETGGYVAFGGGGTSTTSTGWSIRSTGTYNDGRWHMVAVVMGNTGTNLGATLYVDGVQQATNTTGSYYATANGTGTTRFQMGDVEKPVGITGIPGVSYYGTIDEFLLVNAALTASQLSSAMPIGVTAANFAPTQNALTSATVGTSKPFDSISTTANATDIISASIAPQASITSAKVTPSVSVTGATVTPTAVSVTAATVTTAPKNISSSTVQTTGTASKVTVSGSTGLKITAAVPGGVTYGTSVGWRAGDYVYVGGIVCTNVGATANKCATGYDTSVNGSWYPISTNGAGDITVTVGAAVAAYFVNCTGGTGCVVSAGTSKSMLITTSSSHSFAASDAVTFSGASSTITNGSYTVITVPTTTTLTINPAGLGAPTALTATGTATKAVTSAVLTATNTFTTSDTVTVSGLTGVGSANINIADAPITARTSTTLTITISPYAGATIPLTSQTGTATKPITTASFTANNTFINGSAVTVTGLTGSNADVVNVTGATIASVTSTGFTVTIPATTSTVSLTSQAGTATSAVKQVTITATNAFADGNAVTISATGDATLDGTSGTIANRTATGFTYTLTNAYSGTNIDTTTGIAAVARTLVTVTNTDHGYLTGNLVTIAITGGNATLDGTWTITKIDNNSFTYTLPANYTGANLAAVGTASLRTTVVSSAAITPNATITGASIAPQASITSAKVTPSVSVTGATVTPTAVSVTAATVTTAPKNISSSTVQTTGTASKVTVSGSTGLKITAAVPGGVTYGTSVGWRAGDYVYVGGIVCTNVGATANKCATGYDTSVNGSWYPISTNGAGDITVTVGAAVAAYFVNCTGGTGCVVSAGTSKSMLITTSSSHSFAASDAVTFSGASSTITNGSYTVITVPTTTTLTINPAGLGAPTALTATGTATKAVTSAVLTATNTFTTSDTVTVSGLTGVGSANINIADAPITARTSTTLTITISPYAGATIPLTSQTGTATKPITTASFTANNTFINGSAVTVTGLTGSNADVVNVTGATIASVTSTGFTVTIPATTSTVSLTSQAGTATSAVKQVTITATNAFADGNAVTISATGDATLDGTSGTIANRTATGFTYTLTNAYSGTNIDTTTGIAAVAQTTVTVTANNAFVVGNLVTLSGTTGLDGGPYAITSATSTGFTYTVSSYAGPNLITTAGNAMVPLTVVTITDTAHGYVTNDRITITTTGTGAATLNGTFTITKVDANSFRYTISAYSGANLALTGTASTFIPNIKVVGSGFTFVGAEALTITGTGDSRLDTHVCTINAAPTPTATTVYCTLDASITEVPASPALSGTLIANGTSVTVVTSNSLTTSDTVTVAGAGAPFDGVFPVASASGSQFTFTVPSSAYVTSSAGTWAKNITLATITTDAAHGLVATNSVTISGSGSPFDGTFTVVSAPSTTTFTINLTAASGTPTSSDTGLLASKAGMYWAAQLGA